MKNLQDDFFNVFMYLVCSIKFKNNHPLIQSSTFLTLVSAGASAA
jgi:hypothetical protein